MEASYFLGIDISKDSFSCAIKNGSFIFKNRIYKMNLKDFKVLEDTIRPFKENLLIGMEATGIYHKNLFNFFKSRGYNTVEIDPYIMWKFFRFTNSKPTTTDKKSSKAICEFLEFNRDRFSKDKNPSHDKRYSLRYFVREKERSTSDIAKSKTEIRRIISLVFPEIERKTSLFSKEIISFLLEFPSAYAIKKLSKSDFIKKTKDLLGKGKGKKTSLNPE